MEWHKDDALYDPEQIEVVLTIENDSDCCTKWELSNDDNDDNTHVNDFDITRIEVETEPNSALLIKAGKDGVPHFVSSLKSGRRTILKFVFIQEGAQLLDEAKCHVNQFTMSNKKRQKKKIRR